MINVINDVWKVSAWSPEVIEYKDGYLPGVVITIGGVIMLDIDARNFGWDPLWAWDRSTSDAIEVRNRVMAFANLLCTVPEMFKVLDAIGNAPSKSSMARHALAGLDYERLTHG